MGGREDYCSIEFFMLNINDRLSASLGFFCVIKLAKRNVPGPDGQVHVRTNLGSAWVCRWDSTHGWSPMVFLLT